MRFQAWSDCVSVVSADKGLSHALADALLLCVITKRRKTRRELFLNEMDKLIPWKRLESIIKRHYFKNKTGRPAYPLPVMLRVHCLQLIYNYSDPAMEDALYEIEPLRRFAGLRLSERIPDKTTILHFRHLLEPMVWGGRCLQRSAPI